jgi:alcohol dehydrogenase/propanol-preferring alcohol dehydrogenase
MKSYRVTEFGAPLQAVDEPTPKPTGTQVVLRVKGAGVCHSDLHIWEGGYDLGHGRRLSLKDRGIALPLTMGHETAGEVVALGPEASGVKPGELRLVYPWLGCGKCAICLEQGENMCMTPRSLGVYCDGGYADHIVVPHPRYLVDLKGLDPVTAAPYACSGLTTYSALRKVGPLLEREPILIIGAGGLGLMALGLLKALGGKGAVVVDIDAKKREAALAAGALAAVDGSSANARDDVAQAAGGPLRAAIDLVGSQQTTSLAFDSLAKGGKLIIVGLFGGAASWSLPLIPIKAMTIQGSYVGNLAELEELLDLVRAKSVPPIPVTRRPLAEANAALDDLRQGILVGRSVLTP